MVVLFCIVKGRAGRASGEGSLRICDVIWVLKYDSKVAWLCGIRQGVGWFDGNDSMKLLKLL